MSMQNKKTLDSLQVIVYKVGWRFYDNDYANILKFTF